VVKNLKKEKNKFFLDFLNSKAKISQTYFSFFILFAFNAISYLLSR